MVLNSEKILDPDNFFRVAPMWFLNGKFDDNETKRQIKEMKTKGIGGVMPIPIPKNYPSFPGAGMDVDYLSKGYFEHYAVIVEECRRQNMKVWIWDDVFCPSGWAGGKVLESAPSLKAVSLTRYNKGEKSKGKGYILIHEDDEYSYYQEPADDYHVDLLRRETTEKFIEINYEAYRKHFRKSFGNTIAGIFTDEVKYGGCINGSFRYRGKYYNKAIPWTMNLSAEFEKRYKYKLIPNLRYLFYYESGLIEESKKVREDYAILIVILFRQNYLNSLRDWCRKNGLYLIGHLNNEDFLDAHLRGGGDYLYQLKSFDIPGIDVVTRQIFPDKELYKQNKKSYDAIRYNSNFPKLASSATHQSCTRYALCEIFDAYGFGLTLEEMRWVMNYHIVRGINMFFMGHIDYSTKDGGVVSTCSHFGEGNPQWEYFKPFADYIGRACYLTTLGKPAIDTVVLYPVSVLWRQKARNLNDSFEGLMVYLQTQGIDFDLFSIMDIEKSKIINHGLKIGKMVYKQICLCNNIRLTKREKDIFEKLASHVKVFAPEYLGINGAVRYNTVRLNYCPEDKYVIDYALTVYQDLGDKIDKDVDFGEFKYLRFIKRKTAVGVLYYFFNESTDKDYEGEIRIKEQGKIFEIDLEYGEIRSLIIRKIKRSIFKTSLVVNIKRSNALCVIVSEKGNALFRKNRVFKASPHKEWQRGVNLDRQWEISVIKKTIWTREGLGHVTPDKQVKTRCLKDWEEMFGESFTGVVRYKNEFTIDNNCDLLIKCDQVNYIAEVIINDRKVGVIINKPYEIVINRDYLKKGKNEIEIVAANTLANLVRSRDFERMMDKFQYKNEYYTLTKEYDGDKLKSGIFGLKIWS